MTPELVSWIDTSSGHPGWQEDVDLPPQPVVTVGFIVKETGEYLVLCQSMYDQDEPEYYDSLISIPKGCVTSRTKLALLHVKTFTKVEPVLDTSATARLGEEQ